MYCKIGKGQQAFSSGESWLTVTIAFHDQVIRFVDERRAVEVIHLIQSISSLSFTVFLYAS